MKPATLIAIGLTILAFIVFILIQRKHPHLEPTRKRLLKIITVFGGLCCLASMFLLFKAFSIAGDKTMLYKLTLPGMMLVFFVIMGLNINKMRNR